MTDRLPTGTQRLPEAFFADLADEAPSALIAAEADTGTVVAVNEAATELFDRSRSSLIGVHQTELHPPDAEQRHREGFQEVQEGRETKVYAEEAPEVSIQRRDGTTVPVDIRSTTVTYDETTYILGVFQDASDRLERIQQLERQATAMDISPAGIGLLNADEAYTYLNDAHVSMFGYEEADELLGESWTQFYDADVVDRIQSEIFPVLTETGSWDGELIGRTKDGSSLTHHVSLALLPDDGIACVNTDLSGREQTRKQLAETREIVGSLMTVPDRRTAIALVIDALESVLDRPFAGYWSHHGDTNELQPLSVSPRGESAVEAVPVFRSETSLAWNAFAAGEIQYYPDVASHPDAHNPDTPFASEIVCPVGDDGVLIVGSQSVDGIREEDRKIIGIISDHLQTALTLVDRRQQLEAARTRVEAERNQFRQVIDTVPQLIFAKDAAGEFIFANEAVADAYGTTVSELVGSTDAEYSADPDEVEAFSEDDRRVLKTGEPVHRAEETLTDADGNERILETWKIPFTPVGTDERAVLGVANDITELTTVQEKLAQQRRLTSLYSVSNQVLHATTRSKAFDACVDAIFDAVATDSVAIYVRDSEDGGLTKRSVAGDASHQLREQITPGETDLWRAFTEQHGDWFSTDSIAAFDTDGPGDETGDAESRDDAPPDRGAETLAEWVLAIPLNDHSLVTITTDERDETTASFLRAIANQVSAALTQLRQAESIRELSTNVEDAQQLVARYQMVWGGVADTIEAIVDAHTQSDVLDAVLAFGDEVAAYAFIGTYNPIDEHVEVIDVTEPGGPAKLYDRDTQFPAVTAGKENAVQHVAGSRDDTQTDDGWRNQLLYFGYQESIAAPVSHHETVHAVVELISTTSGQFSGPERRAIEVVTDAAGKRLSTLDAASPDGSPIRFDIECRHPSPVFPDLPQSGTVAIERVTATRADILFMTGTAEGYRATTIHEYFRETPGFELESCDQVSDTDCALELSLTDSGPHAFETLKDLCTEMDVRLVGVRGRTGSDVIEFQTTDPALIGDVRAQLTEHCGSCSLISKRHVSDTTADQGLSTDSLGLTERQQSIVELAFEEGYYNNPRGISGNELADTFDISASTLHQHLRAAESKVMDQLFGR